MPVWAGDSTALARGWYLDLRRPVVLDVLPGDVIDAYPIHVRIVRIRANDGVAIGQYPRVPGLIHQPEDRYDDRHLEFPAADDREMWER